MTKSLLRAVIREIDCIGCGKCIPPCPVDAIIGSSKEMHTVIMDECIGCKLCLAPCPVDCIEMHLLPKEADPLLTSSTQKSHIINRYRAKKNRLQQPILSHTHPSLIQDKKAYIQAAILRTKNKSNFLEPFPKQDDPKAP